MHARLVYVSLPEISARAETATTGIASYQHADVSSCLLKIAERIAELDLDLAEPLLRALWTCIANRIAHLSLTKSRSRIADDICGGSGGPACAVTRCSRSANVIARGKVQYGEREDHSQRQGLPLHSAMGLMATPSIFAMRRHCRCSAQLCTLQTYVTGKCVSPRTPTTSIDVLRTAFALRRPLGCLPDSSDQFGALRRLRSLRL